MKHTPGPWELEQNGAAFNLKQEGMPHHMILLGMTYNPPLTHAANAKLIAAAPDLLEALKRILDVEPDYGKANRLGQIELIAEQAIAKATE